MTIIKIKKVSNSKHLIAIKVHSRHAWHFPFLFQLSPSVAWLYQHIFISLACTKHLLKGRKSYQQVHFLISRGTGKVRLDPNLYILKLKINFLSVKQTKKENWETKINKNGEREAENDGGREKGRVDDCNEKREEEWVGRIDGWTDGVNGWITIDRQYHLKSSWYQMEIIGWPI